MEKKNTILLTVIAVATLLVAVVGATFAYFTAQGGATSQADIIVKTGTSASSSFGTYTAISIYADQDNFAQGKPDQTGTTTGTVSWTAPGATENYTPTEAERSMCYTATLNITGNTFVVSSKNEAGDPELVFTAEKGSTKLIDNMNITTTKTDVQIPAAAGGSTYVHKLTADAGKTVTEDWKLTVTLKNLAVDQNDNTGKSFSGAVKFTKTDCQ